MHGADISMQNAQYIPPHRIINMTLPYELIMHMLAFVQYEDVPAWAVVHRCLYPLAARRLRSVRYPMEVKSLKHLHKNTEHVTLHANYTGLMSNVRLEGNGYRVSGIVRRCCLVNCAIGEAVFIHSILMRSTIQHGALAHNVEFNGDCYMETVDIRDNVKGFINMGYLRMVDCTVDSNITGLESRGKLTMNQCSVQNNSVGMHVCGDMERDDVTMRNNTINLLRTQPARPLGRCWTQ